MRKTLSTYLPYPRWIFYIKGNIKFAIMRKNHRKKPYKEGQTE